MPSTQDQTTYAHKLTSFLDLVPDGYQVRLDADTQSAPGDERTQRLDLFFGKEAASLHPGEDELQVKSALLSAYTCMTGGLTDHQAEVVDTYFTVNHNAVPGQTNMRSIARGFNIDDLVIGWTVEAGTEERIFNQDPQDTFYDTWTQLVDAPIINLKHPCNGAGEGTAHKECFCLPLRALPSEEGRDTIGKLLRDELDEEAYITVQRRLREITTSTSGLAQKWDENLSRVRCGDNRSKRFIERAAFKMVLLDPNQPGKEHWEGNLP